MRITSFQNLVHLVRMSSCLQVSGLGLKPDEKHFISLPLFYTLHAEIYNVHLLERLNL
jgi:hypothetical protein